MLNSKFLRNLQRSVIVAAAAGGLLFFPTASKAAGTLPPVLQAALIAKLFQADETVKTKGHDAAKLVILETADAASQNDALEAAFRPTGIDSQRVTPEQLSTVRDISILYIPGTTLPDSVQKFCLEHGILSVAGQTGLAEAGSVSVAFGLNAANRPEIVVNSKRLNLEKHTLSAAFSKLARLVNS